MSRQFRDYGEEVVGEAPSAEDWRRAFILRDYYAGRITREEADKRIAEGKSSEQGNG